MSQDIIPIIMAGGKGSRLWPLSRSSAPKQFIQVIDEKTLFQKTLERVSNSDVYLPPIIITANDFRFTVAEQAREVDMTLSAILLEPVARNTAAAIAAAAHYVKAKFGDDVILQILASDHEIEFGDDWTEAVATASATAHLGKIVTFGIEPVSPATGYGYIEKGIELASGAFQIQRFIEKPPLDAAVKMLETGGFLWNSGIFMARTDLLLSELRTHAPKVYAAAKGAVDGAEIDLDFVRIAQADFQKSPDISIDFAVMEKTSNAAVVPSSFSWSDLGSWDAVWNLGDKDDKGNVVIGQATVLDTENSLVLSRASHLAVQGLKDVAVIASEDAIYVGRLDEAQKVSSLVKFLSSSKDTAHLTETHPTAYRPWGGYTSLFIGDRFQVKRLFVLPGKKLSLQKHFHRSEHWICVKGTAQVTLGEEEKLIQENQSIYIPQGELHRLANPGKIMLEVIEIQTGSYLGEDDIVRISDEFGRGATGATG